ncbi:type VI secretion IcmF C-terminal domain-containing protein [Enterobacter sp. PTB]|uniref:type VI secretion IcmF C-terminal domain-containing protein n=1 Tax=Enterobacter sp. PTB TaxID=3143437 RepID=UPI003DA8F55B
MKTGTRLYSDEPGSWGFIRLLDKALVTTQGDNLYRVAWITPDCVALNYQLRTELGKGPLSQLDLRGFVLPSQIFSTGGIAAVHIRTVIESLIDVPRENMIELVGIRK